MTSPRFLKIAALALAVHGMGLITGLAQNASNGQPAVTNPGISPNKPAPAAEDPGPRMDFRFDGVPLTEAIKLIQAQFHKAAAPKYLNIVIGEHLREIAETNIVTLDVKQVTVAEVLSLIGRASQGTVFYPYGGSSFKGGFSFASATASGGNPTYLLQSEYPIGYSGNRSLLVVDPASSPAEHKTLSYFSLEPLLERYKVEDITTAMKLGWELSGRKGLPTMKFHEETKLLVVSATDEQMAVVNQVIQNLTAVVKTKPQEGRVQKLKAPGAANPAPAPESGIPVSPAKP
ncbi:MAG TPA: hypothetical protein VMB21_00390 [Candidatus Limnocylindria bacterium]|nr:hypothetical protein [Candidatus Limnocylindria bacterium]